MNINWLSLSKKVNTNHVLKECFLFKLAYELFPFFLKILCWQRTS